MIGYFFVRKTRDLSISAIKIESFYCRKYQFTKRFELLQVATNSSNEEIVNRLYNLETTVNKQEYRIEELEQKLKQIESYTQQQFEYLASQLAPANEMTFHVIQHENFVNTIANTDMMSSILEPTDSKGFCDLLENVFPTEKLFGSPQK
ncbi:hypothetical protein BLOT_002952 [Blomia tropicalis]|nr:hypothetical protein BLOT_002952 [Blomia tropicalis]